MFADCQYAKRFERYMEPDSACVSLLLRRKERCRPRALSLRPAQSFS
jgi:hypothetical protein